MSEIPPPTRQAIEAHLNAIAAEFKPGAKLTLLVRNPSIAGDADALFTNDQIPEAIAGLERRHLADIGGNT